MSKKVPAPTGNAVNTIAEPERISFRRAAVNDDAVRTEQIAADVEGYIDRKEIGAKPNASYFRGVGESRRFTKGSEEPVMTPTGPLEDCHLNGTRIGDLNFSPEQMNAIRFEMTDEGRRPQAPPSGRFVDEFDKNFQRIRDYKNQEKFDPFYTPDPGKELTDKYLKPGRVGRFASRRQMETYGTDGYSPVLDEKGQQVVLGNMPFLDLPAEEVKRREDLRKLRDEMLRGAVYEGLIEKNRAILSDAGIDPGYAELPVRDEDRGWQQDQL